MLNGWFTSSEFSLSRFHAIRAIDDDYGRSLCGKKMRRRLLISDVWFVTNMPPLQRTLLELADGRCMRCLNAIRLMSRCL